MGFKDDLRQGSFRGQEFFTDTSQKTLGRRAVLHEFPNRDTPFTEDLGRIAETFEIEGHIIGDDYFAIKKKLEKVFNKSGPGELIHPYYGAKQVQVGVVTISESNLEGMIAKFSAKFFEKGDNRFPKGINDKGALLDLAVEDTLSALDSAFETAFSIANMPANAVNSARVAVGVVTDKMNSVAKIGGAVADGITNLAFATRNLVAEIDDLLNAPDLLASRLQDSFGFLEDAFSTADEKREALSQFFDHGDEGSDTEADPVLGETPVRDQERANLVELNNFTKRTASVRAAGNAVTAEYASFQDAELAREEITAVIEEQIRLDEGTEVFQKMADINALLVETVPDVDADLPNVKTITTDKDQNSLTLIYDLFESPDSEQDMIDRNDIRNPGIISKGTSLEVIDGQ